MYWKILIKDGAELNMLMTALAHPQMLMTKSL